MAVINYLWNPFQERLENNIKNEVIKTSGIVDRVEFIPRYAPFFSKDFVLRRQGTATPLTLGVDYVFGHTFGRFISRYKRNAFTSVIMLKSVPGEVLLGDYGTIGGPFILNDAAFVELVANIGNSPRIVDWDDLTGVPTGFPADPHEQPATQTFDYEEMMTQLKSLVLSLSDQSQTFTVKAMLEAHMADELPAAHAGTKADFGLDNVENKGTAKKTDLTGSSANLHVTVDVLKEAFRLQALGQLPL